MKTYGFCVGSKYDTINEPLLLKNKTMHDIEHNTQLLVKATENGNATEVARLIPLSDPKQDFSYPLRIAAQRGFADCLALLIPVSDPTAKNYDAFKQAASRKHLKCLQVLLPLVNEDAKSEGLHFMAFQQWGEGVAFLVPSVQKSDLSKALSTAALRNSKECFEIIFAQIAALRAAALKGYAHYVDVLYPLGEPTEVVADLRARNANRYEYWALLEALLEKEAIGREIQKITGSHSSVHRKM